MTKGSFLIIENPTGTFGPGLENDAEKAGKKLANLGIDEGFENGWAEKHEIMETLRTAGKDDIVVIGPAHTIKTGDIKLPIKEKTPLRKSLEKVPDIPPEDYGKIGFSASSNWPGYITFSSWFHLNKPIYAKEIIEALNKNSNTPGFMMFGGCMSAAYSKIVLDKTAVEAVVSFRDTVSPELAACLLRKVLEEISKRPQTPIREIIQGINDKRKSDKEVELIFMAKDPDVNLKNCLQKEGK